MRIRFQADGDLDGRVIRGLRRIAPEIDFRSASDAGLESRDDESVLKDRRRCRRILVSQDRRTMPAHFAKYRESAESPGVIMLREGISIASAIEELVLIWSASDAGEWVNRLLWIPL